MKTVIITVLAFMTTLLAILSGTSAAPCESCHSGESPSGGYTYGPPDFLMDMPPKVPPDTKFSAGFVISVPSDYYVESGSARIECHGMRVIDEEVKKFSVDSGEVRRIFWNVESGKEGNCSVKMEVEYTVKYNHKGGASYNRYTYEKSLTGNISIKDASVILSRYAMIFKKGISSVETFKIACKKDVSNITIRPAQSIGDEVRIFPSHISSAPAGSEIKVNVSSTPTITWDEMIYVEWDDEGGHDYTYIKVKSVGGKKPGGGGEESTNYKKIAGIIAGILFILSFTTGFRALKRYLKVKTATLRITHCFLGLSALIVSSYHCIILLISGFWTIWADVSMITAHTTFIFILISTLVGIGRKQMTKKMGYKKWKNMHLLFSILALISLSVHMVVMGSDFAWLRSP